MKNQAQNGLDCRRSRQNSSRYGLHADHAGAGALLVWDGCRLNPRGSSTRRAGRPQRKSQGAHADARLSRHKPALGRERWKEMVED